jgi:hypothetical protein
MLDIEEMNDKIKHLQKIFQKLPRTNRDCLISILRLLFKISRDFERNLMNPENLAIVFTPVVFRSQETLKNPKLLMEQLPKCQKVMRILIEHYPDFLHLKTVKVVASTSMSTNSLRKSFSQSDAFDDEKLKFLPKKRHSIDGSEKDLLESAKITFKKEKIIYSSRKPPKPPIKRWNHWKGKKNPTHLYHSRCCVCHLKIENEFKKIDERYYHESCLQCHQCKKLLTEDFHNSKNRITCKDCGPYESFNEEEIDLGICEVCKGVCVPEDTIVAFKKFFHVGECFRCSKCDKVELDVENYFDLLESPVCRNCYESVNK